MRLGVVCSCVCVLSGIGAGCDGARREGDVAAAPAWLASGTVVQERFGQRLVRGEAERAPEATDVRMPVPYAAVREDGSSWVAPARTVEATLLDGAIAWVDLGGTLFIDDGVQVRAVDDEVHGELAVDPSGRTLAYALRPGERAGVWLASLSGGAPRRVTTGLAVADRPLFVDADRLVVVGSRPGGIAGVWIVRWRDASAQPVAVTNEALRVGEPFGPSFVPPPAYHASMRIEGGALVYHDGERPQRVSLPELSQ